MTKYVFVTGGVVSSVGKGVTVASIGRILKSRGTSVSVMKLDPYLNVDPGTMSPYQHGEVFVTKDGGETDLDLGHYERFIDIELTRSSNLTAGQVYLSLIAKERRGDFLGGTIQTVSHVTNVIKEHILALSRESDAEVVVVEVGGTVGDIEGQPFLEAIRQMRNEVGRDNVYYVHLTLLPYIVATGELKTKPTQHSVKELRGIGIQPDCIILRSDHPVSDGIREKVAHFCDVSKDAVFPLLTVDTIYKVPLILEEWGLGDLLVTSLGISGRHRDMKEWAGMVDSMGQLRNRLPIALVGKYVELQDSYISVKEALQHAGLSHGQNIDVLWVHSEEIESKGPQELLKNVCGIVVPGGFGDRGTLGMIETARYARENKVPYLGLCLGLQMMVVEFARNVLGLEGASSAEMDPDCADPVVDIMPEQRDVTEKGGTMRLGNYPCQLVPGSTAHRVYSVNSIEERHRHRFELNNAYRESLENAGLWATGLSPDGKLVEISEVMGHPFMVGTQYHPEFLSRPNRAHPLFEEFVGAAKETLREGDQPSLPMGDKRPAARHYPANPETTSGRSTIDQSIS
ncbi:CTP synthase [SAR202 cluster bacterium AD-804-J14_MRT_500m]|nr:CTP synthase [SAR202 cluster bacterium AD-804-J14_MRT_500m]